MAESRHWSRRQGLGGSDNQLARVAQRVGLACAICTLILYIATASPGVDWQDSGIHQFRILTAQVENPLGLALSHPLHHWLGRLVLLLPGGDPAYRLNLMSGAFGALGAGLLAYLIVRATGVVSAGFLAAAALALAHPYWQMSVLTETYTLATALMVAEWVLLLNYVRTRNPWYLVAVFGVNGLHVANHLLGLLTLATYGVLLLERIARKRLTAGWLLPCAIAWALGASPYLILITGFYWRTGDAALTLHSALFGGGANTEGWAESVLNTRFGIQQLRLVTLTLGYAFPSLVGMGVLLGLWRGGRRRDRLMRRVLLAQSIIVFTFVARYDIRDLYTFFVPVCALVAFWYGLGVQACLDARPRNRRMRWALGLLVVNAALPLAAYVFVPIWARAGGYLRQQMRDVPFRDEYQHFLRPWKCDDHSPQIFADATLNALQPGDWLLADSTTAYVVEFTRRVHGGPPGIHVFSFWDDLTAPQSETLTADALAEYLAIGGRALAVPSDWVQRRWGEQFLLQPRHDHLWNVRLPHK